jgi:starch synthase
MACGAPGIGTSVASLPEVIDDGVTGSIVAPNDAPALAAALIAMMEDPHRARRMGDAARAAVIERFSWSAVVARCLSLYGWNKRSAADAA